MEYRGYDPPGISVANFVRPGTAPCVRAAHVRADRALKIGPLALCVLT